MLHHELKEKLVGSHRATQIYFIICIVLTHILTARYFRGSFPPCRIFPPLFFLLSMCYVLFPTANEQAVDRGWFHPTLAEKASKNLNPAVSSLACSSSSLPWSQSNMPLVWESRGVLKAVYPVSFNRFPG